MTSPSNSHLRRLRGFSLLEMMVVVFIISIIISFTFPLYGIMRDRADDGACTTRMRSLHTSLSAYVHDNRHWPQIPSEHNDPEKFWRFWINELEPYDAPAHYWMCPTYERHKIKPLPEEDRPEYVGTYVPTQFDRHYMTPFSWSRQPWLLESGNFHRYGAKMLMPDGSIDTLPPIATGQGKR